MQRKSSRRRVLAAIAAVGLLMLAAPLLACSVPVFRYALERWPSDPYQAVIFHRGELTPEQQQRIARLSSATTDDGSTANLEVQTADVDGELEPELEELWQAQDNPSLPWLVVSYPTPGEPAYRGEFSENSASRLIDSPLRREIARRLIKGETSVWILLESGDPEKDDAAFTTLKEQLGRAQLTLKLPEIDEQDIIDGLVSADPSELRIAFSTVRLSRDDPEEQAFVSMLLNSESDLHEFDEPLAFPMFGRGRVLYALVGAGINENVIGEACATLVGPCTCQVKDQNPGTDMLMAVNWDALVKPTTESEKALPPLPGLASFKAKQSDEEIIDAEPDENSSPVTIAATDESAEPKEDEAAAIGTSAGDERASSRADSETEEHSPLATLAPQAAAKSGAASISPVLRNSLIVAIVGLAGIVGLSLVLMVRKGGTSSS